MGYVNVERVKPLMKMAFVVPAQFKDVKNVQKSQMKSVKNALII